MDQANKAGFFARKWGLIKSKVVEIVKSTKKLGQDDPRRIIHSLKVGLALTLVSLVYYYRPLYDSFGISGIWAVITVIVVFEFTVGATISKCLNRGCATFLAGGLGLGAQHLASLFGNKGEPIALGILVFLLAVVSTFTRFFPGIKKRYDYGVLIFILTFSMVTVSGYRVENLLEMAYQRLLTIIIGVSTCMVISIFVFPVWAGEDLHKLVALNIEKLSDSLEGFGSEYFGCSKDEGNIHKSFSKGYKSVLTSKSAEDSLANFAKWELGHGQFRLRHPWKQYLKSAALARQCAYLIEALNGYINSEIQAPHEFRSKIQNPSTKISSESGKALKELSTSIKNMTNPSSAKPHIENAKTAVKDLKFALQIVTLDDSDFLEIIPDATVASILIEIVKCVENLSESVHELSGMASFRNVEESKMTLEKPPLLHRGTVKPVLDGDSNHVVITVLHETCSLGSPEIKKAVAGERVEV